MLVMELLCCVLFMSGAVFALDMVIIHWFILYFCLLIEYFAPFTFQQHEQIDYDLGILLVMASTCVLTLFIFCYFGKLATESYEKMADSLYKCNWHEFPTGQQRYLVTMIHNAQMPLYYHSMRVAVLDLETFCKVL